MMMKESKVAIKVALVTATAVVAEKYCELAMTWEMKINDETESATHEDKCEDLGKNLSEK